MRNISDFVKWAIAHKWIVYSLVAILTIAGAVSLKYLKKDEFPSFVIKQGLVVGIYPGASAQEVDNQLAKPLEDILMSVPEVDRNSIRTVSKEGICYVYIDPNCAASKKDEVWSRIKLKLNAEKTKLPIGVLGTVVMDDFSSISSMLIAIQSEDKSYSELEEYAEQLCTELRRIPELADVKILGTQTEEIAVTIDKEKFSSYGINSNTLMFQYQLASLPVPSGIFKGDDIHAQIHVIDNLNSEAEVAEKIIYSDIDGNIIRLKDISDIERRIKEPDSYITYNSHPCLIISVEMRVGNDIVAFGEKVDKVIENFSEELPDSVILSNITDQPKVVDDSVKSFLSDLLFSMIVVILVMLVMFPLKSALIASSGVPICTALTLAVMYITGIDLNTVTLAALIVVLGMIVDNSIITMDGYIVKLKEGMSRKDASVKSIKELFAPTLAATLAISAMFFPIKFIITGYLGDFVRLLPWVIAIALLISLVYAISVVPSLEIKLIGVSENAGVFERVQNVVFEWLEKIYVRVQKFCFKHPIVTICSGVIALGAAFLCFTQLNVQMMPKAARDFFAIELEVESKNGLTRTKEVTDSLQNMLLKDERVKSVTSFVGTGAPRFTGTYAPITPDKLTSQMIVNTQSAQATEDILREYQNNFEHIFPDALIRYKQIDYQAVDAPIIITLKGPDRELLKEHAESIKEYMMTLSSDLMWIHTTADLFNPVVSVIPDPSETARLGINEAMMSLALSGIYNGQNIATLWEEDNSVSVNVYSDAKATDNIGEIANQIIPTSIPSISVPLRQAATLEMDWQNVMLERRGTEESISIYADMKYGKSHPKVMKKIQRFVDENITENLPEGATIEYGGLSKTNSDVIPEIILAVIAAVCVLTIFMVFHFKKFSLAILTLVMSTLCFFGAFLGLWIFDLDFGLTAILGVISLIGIIVRNGILMYEYAEELRFKEGYDIKTASMLAGQRRMRPIFLTSCTTALGVLPMITGGDLLWQPMGVVICFGTLLSAGLIILIMPVAYWLIFRSSSLNIETNEM